MPIGVQDGHAWVRSANPLS